MTTENDYSFSKGKQKHSETGDFCSVKTDNQFSNLILKQSYKPSISSSVHSQSKPYNNKHRADSDVPYKLEGNSHSWSKSLEFGSNSLTFNDEAEEVNKCWKKESSNSDANNSTLSLHIAAYENSADNNSDELSKRGSKIKYNAEIMPFRKSQKILNFNSTINPEKANKYDKAGRIIGTLSQARSSISNDELSSAIKLAWLPPSLDLYVNFRLGFISLFDYLSAGADAELRTRIFHDVEQQLKAGYAVFMTSGDEDERVEVEDGHLVYKGRLGKRNAVEIVKKLQSGELKEGETFMDIFAKLHYDNGIEAASICKKCRRVFAKRASSRNTFHTHKNYHTRIDDPDFIMPVFIKDLMTESLATMCALDMAPFFTVEKQGFRSLLQTLFDLSYNLGLQHGKNEVTPVNRPEISSILPCPNTIKKHVIDTVNFLTPQFNNYVKEHIEKYGGAVSIDFSTKGSAYYVISIHFLTVDWKLKHYQIEFVEYKEENSAGITILQHFLSTMLKHGITREMVQKNIVITTDRGSNMISAFRNNYVRLDDTCHQANILSKRVTDPFKANYLPQAYNLPQASRDLVAEVSKSLKDTTKIIKGVNARTSLKLKLQDDGIFLAKHTEVRWLSRYKSIDSFLKLNEEQLNMVFDALWNEKANNSYIYRDAITNIRENRLMLVEYCSLIEPFNEFVKVLEAENYVTVNRTLLEYQKLESHFTACLERRNASVHMKALAESGLLVLKYQKTVATTVSDYHYLGLILDPLKKDLMSTLSQMNEEKFREVVKLFKESVQKCCNLNVPPSDVEPASPSPFAAFTNPLHDPLLVEVDSYLRLDSSHLRSKYDDVLDFWSQESENYPRIAKLARRILPITSSCPCERSFNDLGNTLTPHRLCMDPQTVTALLNLKNLKRFEKEQKQINQS